MPTHLLLGDEAVARAALDAGIGGAFSYPGTPATEIFEYVQEYLHHDPEARKRVAARWATNEKVAYEEALGMSYAGKRAIVSMKHVGLNVAADPFINSALTGVNGGVVVVVADDPGMHSSQNEQDSRWYAEFAQVPAFEPSNQQQAYDMTRAAFEYSEAVGLPVLIRLVTRLAHSRATVQVQGSATRAPEPRPPANADDWTLVPTIARRRFAHLLSLQPRLVRDAEGSAYNTLSLAGPQGVIACGIACNYLSEAIGGSTQLSLLKLRQYPLPVAQLRAMVDHCSEILVLEDGYPWLEKRLRGLFGLPGKSIKGRMSGDLPASGELTPDNVAQALGRPVNTPSAVPMTEARRPPQLCKGCPHIDTFKAMLDATAEFERPLLFSDIGCYTLGIMPPYRAVHSCVDMGASISMAHGAAQAGAHPVLCTIGDSTFAHSGMTGLLGAVHSNANMTVFILDNGLVAMTGAQESHATGDDLMSILRGLGVPAAHLRVIDPLAQKHKENVAVIKEEIAHEGLSVVVAVRPCIHMKRKQALA